MLESFKKFLRGGYVFIPSNDKGKRKEEVLSVPLLKRDGLSIEILGSSAMKVGAALTADLGKKFHAGPAIIVDPDSGKKVAGLLLTWGLK